MLTNEQYIRLSLEFNLFFLRIAKEHAIFLAASLPPKDAALSRQAVALKTSAEKLLSRVVNMSQGVVSREVLASNELVTDLTLQAENATQFLTGIPIDMSITKREMALTPGAPKGNIAEMARQVSMINEEAIAALNKAIAFQSKILKDVLSCKAFTYTYPLMLDHVTREARFAVMMLSKLQKKDTIDSVQEIIIFEINWNKIMHEHPEFIRGYLDPSEKALFERANTLANETETLENATLALEKQPEKLPEVTKESIRLVTELRNFKRQGEEGILACKVKSLIPPLLADHVLREANHYLRLLNTFKF